MIGVVLLKKVFSFIFICSVLLFGVSCSHMKSGHYIQLTKADNVRRLSIQYAASEASIMNANPGKKFKAGEWVFIPLNRGIANYLNNHHDYGDYTYEGTPAKGNFLWPVPSSKRISSYFGQRGFKHHDGIDIPGRSGSSILSVSDGKVIYSGNGISGYGNLVIISHGGGLHTVYGHNRKNHVRKGQKVYRGQVIAELGNTGRSTGPHVHFEIRRRNSAVNPMAYLPTSNSRRVASR